MNKSFALIAGLLLGTAASTATAHAAGCTGLRPQSFFGTIESVTSNSFVLHTNSAMGYVRVNTATAHMHTRGETLTPGVFAGVFGCALPNDRAVDAEIVTLASSAQTYPFRGANVAATTTIEGPVVEVRNGSVLVHDNGVHGYTWIVGNGPALQRGETVRATGYFEQNGAAFVTHSIVVVANNGINTIQGRVAEIKPGRMLVKTNGVHGYMWVTGNDTGLRVGQYVRVTGRFDSRNRAFIANSIVLI